MVSLGQSPGRPPRPAADVNRNQRRNSATPVANAANQDGQPRLARRSPLRSAGLAGRPAAQEHPHGAPWCPRPRPTRCTRSPACLSMIVCTIRTPRPVPAISLVDGVGGPEEAGAEVGRSRLPGMPMPWSTDHHDAVGRPAAATRTSTTPVVAAELHRVGDHVEQRAVQHRVGRRAPAAARSGISTSMWIPRRAAVIRDVGHDVADHARAGRAGSMLGVARLGLRAASAGPR